MVAVLIGLGLLCLFEAAELAQNSVIIHITKLYNNFNYFILIIILLLLLTKILKIQINTIVIVHCNIKMSI